MSIKQGLIDLLNRHHFIGTIPLEDLVDKFNSYLKSQIEEMEYPYELIEHDYDKGYKDGFNRCKQVISSKLQ